MGAAEFPGAELADAVTQNQQLQLAGAMSYVDGRKKKSMDSEGHRHVSVFHGRNKRFSPGLVLLLMADGTWEVSDETGEIGPPETAYGTWPSELAACQEALRLLRSRFGQGTLPCWGAGAPNRALAELGYVRGRVRWRWWPPGLTSTGEVPVGPDGTPAISRPPPA